MDLVTITPKGLLIARSPQVQTDVKATPHRFTKQETSPFKYYLKVPNISVLISKKKQLNL